MAEEKNTEEVGTVTYEIKFSGAPRQRVTIPASWKVTYGPLTPGVKGGSCGDGEGAVLRMYEADTKQRAMFRRVVSFIDTSLPLSTEVVIAEEEAAAKSDSDGNESASRKRKVEMRWEESS